MKIKIADMCEHMVDNRGKTPPLVASGRPLLEAQCFSQADYVSSKDAVKYVDEEVYSTFRSGVCYEWDIIVTLVGNIGHCAYALDEFAIAQNVVAIRLKKEFSSKFFFFYTKTEYFKKKCLQLNRSSVQPSLNVNDFLGLEIDIPEYSVQQEIGEKLFLIDCKIRNNNKINSELEAMAKELYEYWFVQFDFPDENGKPYKSSGWKMIYNDELKREIPEEWEVKTLGELSSFMNGINYDKSENGDKDYHIVNVRNITASTLLLDSNDLDSITLKQSQANRYIIKNDNILIARSGAPGATRLLYDNDGNTIFCGFIICCTPNDRDYRLYLTYCLKKLEGTSATTTGGSILQNVSQDTLSRILVVVPRKEIVIDFNDKIKSVISTMQNNILENQQLISLRDFLLPMLMNGQVTVK